ncbi:MAG TPA: type I methionyl aminopeptidase [Chloroflexota bacterium]|nr:type I methionyl aminopeptidase [Chloroflexota bacterium]
MGKTQIKRAVTLKSESQLALMREAGRIVAEVLDLVSREARPGVSTLDLDRLAEAHIRKRGAVPSFKGYRGFPATLCTSLNEEIVHGIPSAKRILRDGDVLKIDCGAIYRGWQGDAARSVVVGAPQNGAAALVDATRAALERGVAATRAGGHVSDIGQAIEDFAAAQGYGVVREYCGHGIGRDLHEEPAVPNYGPAGQGQELLPGMVLCIEPMLNAGTGETQQLSDGWTVKTRDGKLSAHFEHTVAVTESGPRVLTLP